MSLRVSVHKFINRSPRIICKHNQPHKHINVVQTQSITTKTTIACINTNKHHFSTQEKGSGTSLRPPRKLVMSPSTKSSALSGGIPSGYTQQTESDTPEGIIDPISSGKEHKYAESEAEADNTETPPTEEPKRAKSRSTSSSKPKLSEKQQEQQYAYDILNEEILDEPIARKPNEKYDMNALSEEEEKLHKVVQHLINEGFIDELELFKLSKNRQELEEKSRSKFEQFEKDDIKESRRVYDIKDQDELSLWRAKTINNMDNEIVTHKTLSEPLLVHYRSYESDTETYYELYLDSSDLKHILLYLIYNHLNTKRFYELNPSIKELANLLYGIKSQSDFNRLLNIMSRTRKQIQNIMQSYPRQSPPNILPIHDKAHDLDNTGKEDVYKYDEYGQNIELNVRNMTSYELDTTIKRVQDLEFRQYGYTQPQLNTFDDSDEFINIVQNEDEADAETAIKNEEIKKEISEDDVNVTEEEERKGYYNSVMEKVQERWSGDLLDMKYAGGDWRVRLGIAERAIDGELDVEGEVEKQYRRQLNESIAYTTRKRYKISPWTIRSLPYTEAKDLDINFTNVKLLNKFVNDRGMILPRRFTGVDKKTQKRIAKAIKRARKIGFMPHMSKLLIFDKDVIKKKKEELEINKFLQNERDEYDMMNISDLQSIYPEYAPNDTEYKGMEKENDLEIDFDREYEIDDQELLYQNQLRKQQNIFMRQLKQDIVKKIPEYWQKRLSFRDKSNHLVNTMQKRNKQKMAEKKTERSKTAITV